MIQEDKTQAFVSRYFIEIRDCSGSKLNMIGVTVYAIWYHMTGKKIFSPTENHNGDNFCHKHTCFEECVLICT